MPETGIIPNIENFDILISSCQGYSSRYNPSNNKIKIPALQTIQTNAGQSILALDDLATPRSNTIAARVTNYVTLPPYCTRIVNALAASEDVDKRIVQVAQTYVRKIRGERKSKKILNPSPTDAKQISASQRSYFNQAEFFHKLITFVLAQPTYAPNETELKEAALTAFHTLLCQLNQDAIDADTPWLSALNTRNQILYAPKTGMIDIALAVKKYVRSVKSITKEEYNQISKLVFTRPKKKK